jgi:hypothetical protein
LYERLGYVPIGERSDSWETERDGSVVIYEAVVVDLVKKL